MRNLATREPQSNPWLVWNVFSSETLTIPKCASRTCLSNYNLTKSGKLELRLRLSPFETRRKIKNFWIAILNMESMHRTDETLKRAC